MLHANEQGAFARDGFIILKHFLTPKELPIIQKEVARVIASCRAAACVRPNNTLLPLRWNDSVTERFLKWVLSSRRLCFPMIHGS